MGLLDRLLFWRNHDEPDGGHKPGEVIEAMEGYEVKGCFTGPEAPEAVDCGPDQDAEPASS